LIYFIEIKKINNSPTKDEEKRINNVINSSSNLRPSPEKETRNPSEKNKKEFPSEIKIRRLLNYPTSVYSYFLISFGLFYLSCNAAWSEYSSTSLSLPFLIIGIIQYVLGIYDYYQGNNFLSMQNIIFGIRYINFFLNYFEFNGLKRTEKLFSNMQGIIDFILFGFICVFTILIKGEGFIFFVCYFLLSVSCAFFILSGFADDYKIIIQISGYIQLINAICFWLLGMIYIIHDTFNKKIIKFVEPRIK
jgi:hypothetical protein